MDFDEMGLAAHRHRAGAGTGLAPRLGQPLATHGIDLRPANIVTVSMPVALGLNNGVTKEELQEIFLHASVYRRFPATVETFRAAAEVVDGA